MRLKFAAVLPAFLLAVPAVLAQNESADFTVGDIRIEGLQRITEGMVYNYLPVNIGDRRPRCPGSTCPSCWRAWAAAR